MTDRPTAAPSHFPYAHRTLEQVDAQERASAINAERRERARRYTKQWRASKRRAA